MQLAQPVDLSQWPPLFIINSTLPVVDPTSPPSITTLTTALTIGCDALKKVTRKSDYTLSTVICKIFASKNICVTKRKLELEFLQTKIKQITVHVHCTFPL